MCFLSLVHDLDIPTEPEKKVCCQQQDEWQEACFKNAGIKGEVLSQAEHQQLVIKCGKVIGLRLVVYGERGDYTPLSTSRVNLDIRNQNFRRSFWI